mgnify:CR=1 FL=1
MRKILLLGILFLLYQNRVFCQSENIDVNGQGWVDYNFRYDLDENRNIDAFVGFRSIYPDVYDRYVFSTTYNLMHLKPPKFLNLEDPLIHSVKLGTTLLYTNNYGEPNVFEMRLSQGFQLFTPIYKKLVFKHYLRIEERFQNQANSSWSLGFRLRYKVSTILSWNLDKHAIISGFYLPMNVEFFFNLNKADKFNDIIRLSPGIGFRLNDQWKFEFYGMYNNTQNANNSTSSTNDFIFRLRIYHGVYKIKTRKKLNEQEQLNELIE